MGQNTVKVKFYRKQEWTYFDLVIRWLLILRWSQIGPSCNPLKSPGTITEENIRVQRRSTVKCCELDVIHLGQSWTHRSWIICTRSNSSAWVRGGLKMPHHSLRSYWQLMGSQKGLIFLYDVATKVAQTPVNIFLFMLIQEPLIKLVSLP